MNAENRCGRKGIKSIRLALGLDQFQFSKIMGVAHSTVTRWENGEREPRRPKAKKMQELGAGVGITLSLDEIYKLESESE